MLFIRSLDFLLINVKRFGEEGNDDERYKEKYRDTDYINIAILLIHEAAAEYCYYVTNGAEDAKSRILLVFFYTVDCGHCVERRSERRARNRINKHNNRKKSKVVRVINQQLENYHRNT